MENAIAIQNLAAYNRGELRFKWIELPTTDEKIEQAIKEVLDTKYNDEEIHIADFNDHTGGMLYRFFGEYSSPYKVNEFIEMLDGSGLTEEQVEVLSDICDSKEEFIEKVLFDEDYYILYDIRNKRQLGERLVFDFNYLSLTPKEMDKVSCYLNYEYIGREAELAGWNINHKLGIAVKINW